MRKYIICALTAVFIYAVSPVQAFAIESFEQITLLLTNIF